MCATPDESKHLGRKIKIKKDWDNIKDQIMYEIVKAKFSNPFLAKKLINTGDEILCEGNYWHDNYWGACNCPNCKLLPRKNMLGQILMRVREELKNN